MSRKRNRSVYQVAFLYIIVHYAGLISPPLYFQDFISSRKLHQTPYKTMWVSLIMIHVKNRTRIDHLKYKFMCVNFLLVIHVRIGKSVSLNTID